MREWFCDVQIPSDLRHKKKQQDEIKDKIHANHKDIKELKFDHATYHWKEHDIYKWLISSKQSKRKYNKTRVRFLITLKLFCYAKKVNEGLIF